MKINYKSIIINFFLLILFIYVFIHSSNIKYYVLYAINIWVNNLIPTIFPFLLLSKLLINYGFISFLSNVFGKIIKKIFNINKNSSFAIITSIFTGFPTGAIYIKDLLLNNSISLEEANHLITFTNFANPLFIISGIGENLLNNKKIGIYIFIIHLFTGLLTGILFKSKKKTSTKSLNKRITNKNFITILTDSINDIFKILINILGIIIFFLFISSFIESILPNNAFSIILRGIIEMSTGISFISLSKMNLRLKISIIGFLLSFSGISIHFQTKNIIDDTNISFKKYLLGRIVHSLLCFIISYILFYTVFGFSI